MHPRTAPERTSTADPARPPVVLAALVVSALIASGALVGRVATSDHVVEVPGAAAPRVDPNAWPACPPTVPDLLDPTAGCERWRLDEPTIGIDVAAVEGGRAYVVRGDRLLAVDVTSGSTLWEADVTAPPAGPPVVDRSRVVLAGATTGTVVAYGADSGQQVWEYATGVDARPAVAVGDRAIVAGTDTGTVHHLDSWRGAVDWVTDVGGRGVSTPAVDHDHIAVTTTDGGGARLVALDPADGQVRWSVRTGLATPTRHPPVIIGDVVVVGSGRSVEAHDAGSGALVWTRELDREARRPLLLTHELLIAGESVLDAWTGALVWRLPPSDSDVPVAALGGAVIQSTGSGELTAWNVDGSRRWRWHDPFAGELHPASSPDTVLVVTSADTVAALSTPTSPDGVAGALRARRLRLPAHRSGVCPASPLRRGDIVGRHVTVHGPSLAPTPDDWAAPITVDAGTYEGPIALEGMLVGGGARLRFGVPADPDTHALLDGPRSTTTVSASEPGCYVLQVDGTSFTDTIVFEVPERAPAT